MIEEHRLETYRLQKANSLRAKYLRVGDRIHIYTEGKILPSGLSCARGSIAFDDQTYPIVLNANYTRQIGRVGSIINDCGYLSGEILHLDEEGLRINRYMTSVSMHLTQVEMDETGSIITKARLKVISLDHIGVHE